MFRFTQETSAGSQSQSLAKITGCACRYVHARTCACVCGSPCTANHTQTHIQQIGICRHNTGNAHINKHSGTIPVILARH